MIVDVEPIFNHYAVPFRNGSRYPVSSHARILDCNWPVDETGTAIKQAGFETVIRYYARGSGDHVGKTLTKKELNALDHAGLSVAVVFQNNNSIADLFYDENKKSLDVAAAIQHAGDVKQPTGTPIYFGADFNIAYRRKKNEEGKYYKDDKGNWILETSPAIQKANEEAVYAYFAHASQELATHGYTVGIYGCGRAAEVVGGFAGKPKVAKYFWLSASTSYAGTSDFYNNKPWHLFQNKTELPSELIPKRFIDEKGHPHNVPEDVRRIDIDILNEAFEDFGQWRPGGLGAKHPAALSKAVRDDRAFLKRKANIYSGPDTHSPVVRPNVRVAANVRVLDRSHQGFCGVSLNESEGVLGYCRAEDLTTGLNNMPDN